MKATEKNSYRFLQQLFWGGFVDQGEMAESVAVTLSLLGSQPGSLEHSQRTSGVPGSHSDTGDFGFAKELPEVSQV